MERDVKMNDGGDDPIYGGTLVLIATTNRQTDAFPFLRRVERHARSESCISPSAAFYAVLNRIGETTNFSDCEITSQSRAKCKWQFIQTECS